MKRRAELFSGKIPETESSLGNGCITVINIPFHKGTESIEKKKLR